LLLDERAYLDVLRDHAEAEPWEPPGTDFVSQFQSAERIFIQHNQEGVAPPRISLPVQGTVVANGVTAARALTDLVNAGAAQTTITLRLDWTALGARYELKVDPATLPAERYHTLAVRVGQSTDPNNPADHDQDFSIVVSGGSRTFAVRASALHRLLYPDHGLGAGKIVMQSLRLPLARLSEHGIHLSDIRSIAFLFDRRATGTIYVGDVQVSD
jgi:hypothetical protein